MYIRFSNWSYSYIPQVDKIMKEAYGPGVPSASELEKRTAIAFVSTTPVFDTTQPLPENVIQVAGLHVKDPKPLPKVSRQLTIKFAFQIFSNLR